MKAFNPSLYSGESRNSQTRGKLLHSGLRRGKGQGPAGEASSFRRQPKPREIMRLNIGAGAVCDTGFAGVTNRRDHPYKELRP